MMRQRNVLHETLYNFAESKGHKRSSRKAMMKRQRCVQESADQKREAIVTRRTSHLLHVRLLEEVQMHQSFTPPPASTLLM